MTPERPEPGDTGSARLREAIRDAHEEIAALKATNAKLRSVVSAEQQRAAAAEEAMRRAYRGFAASATRR